MSMNVNKFRAELFGGKTARGLAKQSKFDVFVFPPIKLFSRYSLTGASAVKEMRFRVETIQIPGRTVQSFQHKDLGYNLQREIGYQAQYAPITATVLVGKDLGEKKLFQDWQGLIVGNHLNTFDNTDTLVGYPDDYRGTVNINTYGDDGFLTHTAVISDAFPKDVFISPSQWASEDYHRVTVTFSYRRYFEIGTALLNDPKALLAQAAIGGVAQQIGKIGSKAIGSIQNTNVRNMLGQKKSFGRAL